MLPTVTISCPDNNIKHLKLTTVWNNYLFFQNMDDRNGVHSS